MPPLTTPYQHSGKWGFAPVLMPLLGMPILFLLGVAHAYVVVYNPVCGIVNILVLIGFIFGMFMTLRWLAKLSKCRSRPMLLAAGALGGAFGLYVSWVFFVYALARRGDHDISAAGLFFRPDILWEIVCAIGKDGWYSVKSVTPSGFFIWIFWISEALAVLLGVAVMTPLGIDREIFCEECGKWAKVCDTRHLRITAEMGGRSAEQMPVDRLITLPALPGIAYPCIKAEVLACPDCGTTAGLRYAVLRQEVDDKGKISEKSDEVPGVVLVHQFNRDKLFTPVAEQKPEEKNDAATAAGEDGRMALE
jgi:hypothetical protein